MLSSNKKLFVGLLVVVLLAIVAGVSLVSLMQKRAASSDEKKSEIEPAAIVREVGNLIELPTGEQPSVAVVNDVKKLQDQEIFRKAKNGDILLIYVQAKQAYLYDPAIRKLVDVAPVNVQETEPPTPSPFGN